LTSAARYNGELSIQQSGGFGAIQVQRSSAARIRSAAIRKEHTEGRGVDRRGREFYARTPEARCAHPLGHYQWRRPAECGSPGAPTSAT